MILTVNLGNTHITIGGYEHDDLKFCGRLHRPPPPPSMNNTCGCWTCFRSTARQNKLRAAFWAVVPALTGRGTGRFVMPCWCILTVGPTQKRHPPPAE